MLQSLVFDWHGELLFNKVGELFTLRGKKQSPTLGVYGIHFSSHELQA